MGYLLAGLVVFLGVHSIRIFADGWRARVIAERGEKAYKALFSLASLIGFALIVWGFDVARNAPVVLWIAPAGMRHATALLTLIAFIFLVAAYVPGNHLKARFHHPMVLGVKSWALAHLLSNGTLAHVFLFGGFLAWAVVDFIASRRRDRIAATVYPAGRNAATVTTLLIGLVTWALFALWGHGLLIGIKPFG